MKFAKVWFFIIGLIASYGLVFFIAYEIGWWNKTYSNGSDMNQWINYWKSHCVCKG